MNTPGPETERSKITRAITVLEEALKRCRTEDVRYTTKGLANCQAQRLLLRTGPTHQRMAEVQGKSVPRVRDRRIYAGQSL